MHPLARGVLDGDPRALGRVCRVVDDRVAGHRDLLRQLYPHTGHAWVVGVTGNPGAGKSTLTDALVAAARREHDRVAVVAVDPTSPFTGGAILGDRIRMQRHFEDTGVFIRSVATRGALGGLSRSVADIVHVLDAWGAGVVLVETVGVGQDELDVTRQAHTTLVVTAPGMGDDVQAIKAGILECADVFAVNKADRPGADATVRDLENMIALGEMTLARASAAGGGHGGWRARGREPSSATGWTPPVVRTVALRDEGIEQLSRALGDHRRWTEDTPEGRQERRRRAREQLYFVLRDTLVDAVVERLRGEIDGAADRIEAREVDPYDACDALVSSFRK